VQTQFGIRNATTAVLYCQERVGPPFGNDGELTARGWPVRLSLVTPHPLRKYYYNYPSPILALDSRTLKANHLLGIDFALEGHGERQHHGIPQEDLSFERTQKTFQDSTHVWP
jgi:hypothetical protein